MKLNLTPPPSPPHAIPLPSTFFILVYLLIVLFPTFSIKIAASGVPSTSVPQKFNALKIEEAL